MCKTEKYWSGWFKGLSEKFIASPVQKLLLLANIDRLDKNLMVGQMQGLLIFDEKILGLLLLLFFNKYLV